MKRARMGIGIALVLAAIAAWLAYPWAMAHHRRGQQAEAYRELPRLLAQQKRFKAELDEFLTVGPEGPLPGTPATPWAAPPCPAECRRLDIGACTSFACLDFAPASPVAFRYACRAHRRGDAYDVSCAAVADLDGDGARALLVIGTSTTGHLVAALPELGVTSTACATLAELAADRVHDCTPGAL